MITPTNLPCYPRDTEPKKKIVVIVTFWEQNLYIPKIESHAAGGDGMTHPHKLQFVEIIDQGNDDTRSGSSDMAANMV